MAETLGNYNLSFVAALAVAMVVVFFLGYGLGWRRGQKKRRWYS
jgi:VIT1/CCC1 family predicted Fe2+/Mn2+ transporter